SGWEARSRARLRCCDAVFAPDELAELGCEARRPRRVRGGTTEGVRRRPQARCPRGRMLRRVRGCDRAVFALDHDEWALVHLTWIREGPEIDPRWPTVEALGSWPEVLEAMREHSQRYDVGQA